MTVELKLGCDPEVFLRDTLTNEFVSAHGKFPGTKAIPHKIAGGAIQVDGMALEFNIEPASSQKEWLTNIATVLDQMNDMVHKVDPYMEMVFEPWADFDRSYFSILPLESKILGCDPDFSSDGLEKVPTEDLMHSPFRTAAGHVHIGWTKNQNPMSENHFNLCKTVSTKFLNVPGYFPVTTMEKRRTSFYGGPGSFRPKPYGIELRSPSNHWVESTPGRVDMYNRTIETATEIFR